MNAIRVLRIRLCLTKDDRVCATSLWDYSLLNYMPRAVWRILPRFTRPHILREFSERVEKMLIHQGKGLQVHMKHDYEFQFLTLYKFPSQTNSMYLLGRFLTDHRRVETRAGEQVIFFWKGIRINQLIVYCTESSWKVTMLPRIVHFMSNFLFHSPPHYSQLIAVSRSNEVCARTMCR